MIKIIEISNCHLWDGLEVNLETFNYICGALENSKWQHSIEFSQDGITTMMHFGGK